MTTSKREEVARRSRRQPRPRGELRTFGGELVRALVAELETRHTIRFPAPEFQREPVRFFRQILGVDPWDVQIEVLEALRDHDRVAWKSGRRVAKSHTVSGFALWRYCSWPDARVIMSSTTARQVDQILWREVSMMRARSGRCLACRTADPNGFRIPRPCPHSALIDGEIGMLARTGLKSDDFREIVGFTAREAEAVQGIAGSNLTFCLDEASGIPQVIYEAIEGNRAGGGKVLLTGNPTKNQGEFFDAFHTKRLDPENGKTTGYFCITTSSEQSPNVVAGREVIPGLATAEYIRERELEWGRESALFIVHVLGEFALAEEGRIFNVALIAEAEQRWEEAAASGRLFIGCDPAGASGMGDESAFAVRRGLKVLELYTRRGLSEEAHLVELRGLVEKHALPRETPVIVIDREGPIGSGLYGRLRSIADGKAAPFEVVGVRSSDRAVRKPAIYDRLRDELAANLEQWFRDGGAIPTDTRLAEELHSLEWEQAINGKLKITRKTELRKELGRSPDRYDAIALAAWEPLSLAGDELPPSVPQQHRGMPTRGDDLDEPVVGGLDPYAGAGSWGRR